MCTVPFKRSGEPAGYALGIVDAGWYRGHSGGGFGFLSDMYWAPEAGVGVAVLTNSDNHPLQQVLSEPDPPGTRRRCRSSSETVTGTR